MLFSDKSAFHANSMAQGFPPLTEGQKRISDDFMKYWYEVVPKQCGIIDHFNQGCPTFPINVPSGLCAVGLLQFRGNPLRKVTTTGFLGRRRNGFRECKRWWATVKRA